MAVAPRRWGAALWMRHQLVRLICRKVTSRFGPNVLLLEAPDGCAGPWPQDAVDRPFVIAQAMQCFLNLSAIRLRHFGLRRQDARQRGGCGCSSRQSRRSS
jgi:hypothetical protein